MLRGLLLMLLLQGSGAAVHGYAYPYPFWLAPAIYPAWMGAEFSVIRSVLKTMR